MPVLASLLLLSHVYLPFGMRWTTTTKNNPLRLSTCHNQQEMNNYPSNLPVCLCPYPPVCLCVSVLLSVAFPPHHWVMVWRRKWTITPLVLSLELSVESQQGIKIDGYRSNGLMSVYVRTYTRTWCCIKCVVVVKAVNMFAGWWVRRLLYLKRVFALVTRSSPASWCWPYKHVGPGSVWSL